ncbi:MAG TPA: hypothetical protein EYM37_08770 [Methylophaga aminisulfidivorans]|uniref:hypothetical protein n=1 Tax=Methylophaga TaxID=40222 RepID=UPI0017654D68|nr:MULTISPECIES: hypothetical protein [Methylophaga]HIC46407.1 hypothetical protein [Methylophaga sp.]HIM40016.1 hypothetical protein [Methylophaga aminisulfidivorans]
MKEQLSLYDGLRNVAAIVFGVMGAWLAILHPDSIKKVFNSSTTSLSDQDKTTIKLLMLPIIISTFILFFVLITPLLVAISKTITIFVTYKTYFRGISFAMLVVITLLQIWTLILTLIPNQILKSAIQKLDTSKMIREGLFSRTKKIKK